MKKMRISGRLVLYSLFILIQCALLVAAAADIGIYFTFFYQIIRISGVFVVFHIILNDSHSDVKTVWILFIYLFPVIAIILYAVSSVKKSHLKGYGKFFPEKISENNDTEDLLKKENITAYRISRYISNMSGCCAYRNTLTEFFGCGEDFFSDYIGELEKAEKFIYIEYFIICKGEMWNRILDILIKKAKSGVDVRIIYDGLGTVNFFGKNYFRKLSEHGIKSTVISSFIPAIDTLFKSCDHRKITVIDNRTAYTGGLNLSDEYINVRQIYGYWKDYAVKVKGDGAEGFTLIFLNTWDFCMKSKSEIPEKIYSKYNDDGYIIPFGDVPYGKKYISKTVYMEIIRNASAYVYITTPYLVLDNEMITALVFAAQGGADVRIITPHIPDKKYVHAVTRMNYRKLLETGIRIFEYSDGFIHAKSVVSDDKFAVTGTVNFDFRSFNMLFENSVFMYDSTAVLQIRNDCLKMFDECIEITEDFFEKKTLLRRIYNSVMKILSPLM